jgi:hypothetical protein
MIYDPAWSGPPSSVHVGLDCAMVHERACYSRHIQAAHHGQRAVEQLPGSWMSLTERIASCVIVRQCGVKRQSYLRSGTDILQT